jgi:hypothetical protein
VSTNFGLLGNRTETQYHRSIELVAQHAPIHVMRSHAQVSIEFVLQASKICRGFGKE